MRRFRAIYKDKGGSVQYMSLMARDKTEAEQLAGEAQYRRKTRQDLTFQRLEDSLSGAELKAQVERRKEDFGRDLKLVKVEEL